jgi:Peptidase family M50.
MYELLVLLMLNVIVLVHEMGHYITAKILHIQPKTFAIGFLEDYLGV